MDTSREAFEHPRIDPVPQHPVSDAAAMCLRACKESVLFRCESEQFVHRKLPIVSGKRSRT
jgi:hypothetical protein